MKKTFSIISFFILLTFSLLNVNSCSSREDTVSCFPDTPINVTLLPSHYFNLQTQQWTYVEMDGAGTRGLIVVKNGNTYRAYDRNAPHICPGNDTTLNVEFPFVVCPKDNAKWNILDGGPLEVSPRALKSYFCNFDSTTNTISIYN
jgi:nitrite reductase/ring-hydroxylating ferredoxin subunit